MGLVPFTRNSKPAGYAAPSGPNSSGRMPKRSTTPKRTRDSGPADSYEPAPPVDGALRGHDPNYPRKPARKS